jgi:hypothetical protein
VCGGRADFSAARANARAHEPPSACLAWPRWRNCFSLVLLVVSFGRSSGSKGQIGSMAAAGPSASWPARVSCHYSCRRRRPLLLLLLLLLAGERAHWLETRVSRVVGGAAAARPDSREKLTNSTRARPVSWPSCGAAPARLPSCFHRPAYAFQPSPSAASTRAHAQSMAGYRCGLGELDRSTGGLAAPSWKAEKADVRARLAQLVYQRRRRRGPACQADCHSPTQASGQAAVATATGSSICRRAAVCGGPASVARPTARRLCAPSRLCFHATQAAQVKRLSLSSLTLALAPAQSRVPCSVGLAARRRRPSPFRQLCARRASLPME